MILFVALYFQMTSIESFPDRFLGVFCFVKELEPAAKMRSDGPPSTFSLEYWTASPRSRGGRDPFIIRVISNTETAQLKGNLLHKKNLIVIFHVCSSFYRSYPVIFCSIIVSLPWWLQFVWLLLDIKKYLSNISSHIQVHITLFLARRNKYSFFWNIHIDR